MPPMKKNFKRQLTAFDKDYAKAENAGKALVAEKSVGVHKRQLRTALLYREQVELHVKEMLSKGASELQIEAYLMAARKMFRGYLGIK